MHRSRGATCGGGGAERAPRRRSGDAHGVSSSPRHGGRRVECVPNVSCTTPRGAFYAFPNVSRTGFTSHDLADALLDEPGVAVLAGPSFGVRRGPPEALLRGTLENLEAALAAMEASLELTPRSKPPMRRQTQQKPSD